MKEGDGEKERKKEKRQKKGKKREQRKRKTHGLPSSLGLAKQMRL